MHIFCLLLGFSLFCTGVATAALPGRPANALAIAPGNTPDTANTAEAAKSACAVSSGHLSFFQKLRMLTEMHRYRLPHAGDTHYGRLAFGLVLLPSLLLPFFYLAGALTGPAATVLLVLTFFCYLGGIIFGLKGLKTDRHHVLAVIGLVWGLLGLLYFALGGLFYLLSIQ